MPDLPRVAPSRETGPSKTRCESGLSFFSRIRPQIRHPSHHLARGDGSAASCPPYNPHGLPPAAASAATQDTAGISSGESDHAHVGVLAFCSAP